MLNVLGDEFLLVHGRLLYFKNLKLTSTFSYMVGTYEVLQQLPLTILVDAKRLPNLQHDRHGLIFHSCQGCGYR